MTFSAFLEVAIGLIVVYYILGLIVSVLVEITKTIFDIRADVLEAILIRAFGEGDVQNLGQTLFLKNDHHDNSLKWYTSFKGSLFYKELMPIKNKVIQIKNRNDLKPAKISNKSFSFIILDILLPNDPDTIVNLIQRTLQKVAKELDLPQDQQERVAQLVKDEFESDKALLDQLDKLSQLLPEEQLKESISRIIDFWRSDKKDQMEILRATIEVADMSDELRRKLRRLLDYSVEDLDDARKRLEEWFDGIMVQVSALFTQWVRYFVVAFSLLVTVFVGADSIEIFQYLVEYPAQRATIQAAIPALIQTYGDGEVIVDSDTELVTKVGENLDLLSQQLDELQQLNLPLHPIWPTEGVNRSQFFSKVIGLLITATAVSQGSSFWYDILKQINPSSSSSKKEEKATG